jgi:hypothetical protein
LCLHRATGYTRFDDVSFDGQPSADALTFEDTYYGMSNLLSHARVENPIHSKTERIFHTMHFRAIKINADNRSCLCTGTGSTITITTCNGEGPECA